MASAPSSFRFNYLELQMNFVRTVSIFSAVAATTMAMPTWAASDAQHDSHHPTTTETVLVAQATTTAAGMGKGMGKGGMAAIPGAADQMKAMMQMMMDRTAPAPTAK